MDCKQLGRALAALDKLENDVENHGLAVLERRFSSDRWAGKMVQQKKETRRNSCHQYKIKQEETKSSKRPLSWRGIVAADDAGLQKAAPNSNASGDTKSKKKKDGT